LLVIARALACLASLVILDEVTAAIDAYTNSFVQKVLRTEFATATTISVAHRLKTIVDSDYILVMEMDMSPNLIPRNLCSLSRGGMFRDLVQAAKLENRL
jgi:ABC-type transport system involved in cytochrome bd biosynthesis fused ATPase/permease subunit